jgi:GNAT superfamily N-acetyltransferase
VIEVAQLSFDRLGEWLELRNRIESDDPLGMDILVSRRQRDPSHVDLLATLDGVPAGVGVYGHMVDDPVSPIGRTHFRVLPELRRRGVGTALHRTASELGRANGDEELEGEVADPAPDTLAYLEHRGYRRVQLMIESRLDLSQPSEDGERAAVELASVAERPEALEDAYRIALESEPDIPESREWVRPASFDDWKRREVDDLLFVPELSLVAYVDGMPAAYGLVQTERDGVAGHLATGVARAHRGAGLATALKRAQIAAARAAGLRELVTWNEESNVPIRRVNAKLGYRVAREVVRFRGPLL